MFQGGLSDYLADVSHNMNQRSVTVNSNHSTPEIKAEPSPSPPPPGAHPFCQIPADICPLRCALQHVLLGLIVLRWLRCRRRSKHGDDRLDGGHWEASCRTSIRLGLGGAYRSPRLESINRHFLFSLTIFCHQRWCHLQFSA